MTPEAPLATWIVAGLLLFGLVVFYPAIGQLPFSASLSGIKIAWLTSAKKSETRVWVNRRSGLYYCVDSQGYGKLKPGQFLAEQEARQSGFRPAPKAKCADEAASARARAL